MDFKRIQFWVQVLDLVQKKFSAEDAQKIENSIGKYIETDSGIENISKCYLRLKVVVDTQKLLKTRFWWMNSQKSEIWVNIKYERLSDLCYGCERLGHTTQSCK